MPNKWSFCGWVYVWVCKNTIASFPKGLVLRMGKRWSGGGGGGVGEGENKMDMMEKIQD